MHNKTKGHIDCDIKNANTLVRRVFVYWPQIKTTQRHIPCHEPKCTVKSLALGWFVCRLTLRKKRIKCCDVHGKVQVVLMETPKTALAALIQIILKFRYIKNLTVLLLKHYCLSNSPLSIHFAPPPTHTLMKRPSGIVSLPFLLIPTLL